MTAKVSTTAAGSQRPTPAWLRKREPSSRMNARSRPNTLPPIGKAGSTARHSPRRGKRVRNGPNSARDLLHGPDDALNDLVHLVTGDDQRRGEPEDVAMGHGAHDDPLFQAGRRQLRPDAPVGLEALLLRRILRELDGGQQPRAAHLGDVGPVRELAAQPLQEVRPNARRVLRELLALDDVQVGERRGARRPGAPRTYSRAQTARRCPDPAAAPATPCRPRARRRAADSRW